VVVLIGKVELDSPLPNGVSNSAECPLAAFRNAASNFFLQIKLHFPACSSGGIAGRAATEVKAQMCAAMWHPWQVFAQACIAILNTIARTSQSVVKTGPQRYQQG
jgi:hypothetical protein